jgi:nucleotide-binding universal stress UspA family protein
MNANPRPVVIALDGSPRAAKVFDVGLALASALGAPLHVLRTVGIEGEAHEHLDEKTPAEQREAVISAAARDLRTIVQSAPAEMHVVVASPVAGICAWLKEHDARLLVIGTHGYGTLERLLGTTASRLVEQASCDVYVVRAGA